MHRVSAALAPASSSAYLPRTPLCHVSKFNAIPFHSIFAMKCQRRSQTLYCLMQFQRFRLLFSTPVINGIAGGQMHTLAIICMYAPAFTDTHIHTHNCITQLICAVYCSNTHILNYSHIQTHIHTYVNMLHICLLHFNLQLFLFLCLELGILWRAESI